MDIFVSLGGITFGIMTWGEIKQIKYLFNSLLSIKPISRQTPLHHYKTFDNNLLVIKMLSKVNI